MTNDYAEQVARTRAAYKEARERFAARLRNASDADVHHVPAGGGWSAAQIGWHVAAVDASFASILASDSPVPKAIPAGETARTWTEVVAGMPAKLEAGKRVSPPADASRDGVLASLDDSARKLDAALAALPEDRASGFAITHPALGTIALGLIGEWATAHVIRHNAQAKRVLAEVSAT